MALQRDVAIRYALEYTDKGLARAITTTRTLEQASQRTGAAVTLAARRQQDEWKLLDRQARQFDTATSQRALSQASAVSRGVDRQVGQLRKLGATYTDISKIMRSAGVSAEQTAGTISKAASKEEAAYSKLAAARERLSRLPGSIGGRVTGGGGSSAVGSARSRIGSVASGAIGFGAGMLLGGISLSSIKQAVDGTQQLALATRNLTAITGMDAKTAAEWVAITQARGISTRTFGMSLKTLATQTAGAMSGSKASVKVFHELGISQQEVKSHSHDLSGMLGLVADHLNKMPGGAEKTAIASKLLGRNWMALLPILTQGSKGMAAQRQEAAALGVTLGGNSAVNAKKLEEASVKLKLAQTGLSVQFSEHVAPALIKVTEFGIKLATAVGHDLTPAFHTLAPVVRDVGHWLVQHKDVVRDLLLAYAGFKIIKTVGGMFGGLYNDVKRVSSVISALATVSKDGVKSMFAQQSETEKLTVSNNELAAALERVVLAQKELARSGGGMPGGMPSGPISAPASRGAPLASGERAIEQEMAQSATQSGILGGLFGRQGASDLKMRLTQTTMKAGAGIMGAFLGNQAGQMVGQMTGNKTVGGIATAVGTGAGAGMAFGAPGAVVGGVIGGVVGGAQQIAKLFGVNQGFSGAVGKLQAQMADAANRGDMKKLAQLGQEAQAAAKAVGEVDPASAKKFNMLGDAAQAAQRSLMGTATHQLTQSMSGARTVGQVMQGITPTLNRLPTQFQDAGALAAIKFAYGMQQKGQLPRGATDQLIRSLEAKYPALASYLQRAGASSMQMLADQFRVNKVQGNAISLINSIHKTFTFLPDYANTAGNSTQAKMKTTMASLQQIIKTGTASQRAAAISELAKLVNQYLAYMNTLGKRTQDSLNASGHQWVSFGNTVIGIHPELATIQQNINDVVNVAKGINLSGPSAQWQNFGGSIAQQINSVSSMASWLGTLAGAANTAGSALASVNVGKAHGSISFQRGGYAHERMGWIVPGDPTRDGTLAMLSGDEAVITGPGQRLMDRAAPGLLEHVIRNQLPHFATGGRLSARGISEEQQGMQNFNWAQNTQTRETRIMDRSGVDPSSVTGLQLIYTAQTQVAPALHKAMKFLRKARTDAHNHRDWSSQARINQEIAQVNDALDQASADLAVDKRNLAAARRDANPSIPGTTAWQNAQTARQTAVTTAETAAQAPVDTATHGETMASSGLQNLELGQQLAGTFNTPAGGAAVASYITNTVEPAIQSTIDALTKQEAVAKKEGDTTLANQIAESIATKQNDLEQAKLDALNAIKTASQQTATNTAAGGGQLGVSFGGQTFPDLAGILNGA